MLREQHFFPHGVVGGATKHPSALQGQEGEAEPLIPVSITRVSAPLVGREKRASVTPSRYRRTSGRSAQEMADARVTDGLLRISVGIED
jgi:hypothetical protein